MGCTAFPRLPHSPDFLRAQIDACFDDFRIGAVKLGMLANRQVIDALERHQPDFIVLDPVMVATSGALARAGCPRCAAFTLARALDESRPSRRLLPRSRS
jgi:hypothetical protein